MLVWIYFLNLGLMDNRSMSTATRCRSVCRSRPSTTAIVRWSWKGQSFWRSRNWWCPAQMPHFNRRTITCPTRRSMRPLIGQNRCRSIENWSTAPAINENESDEEGANEEEDVTANFWANLMLFRDGFWFTHISTSLCNLRYGIACHHNSVMNCNPNSCTASY